ncbi:MAG: T9SS type A sorting domain-containing protein [Bacteroidota bacterium]
MKIKLPIALFILISSIVPPLLSQNYYCAAHPNDDNEILLYIRNLCGTSLQWQERALETEEWIDIAGATSNPFTLDLNTFSITGKAFRAKILLTPDPEPKYSYPFGIRLVDDYAQLTAGDLYDGSFVYYNNNDTILGTFYTEESMPWGCKGTQVFAEDEDHLSIGLGAQNTAAINAVCTETNAVASRVAELSINGFDDWFLPSLEELKLALRVLSDNRIQQIQRFRYTGFEPDTRIIYSMFFWASSERSATHGHYATTWNGEILDGNYAKDFIQGLLPSRTVDPTTEMSNYCEALLYPRQYNDHITVTPVNERFNPVQIEFIGTADESSTYTWDFDHGTHLAGFGVGPYDINFVFGGHNEVTLKVTGGQCDGTTFYSPVFKIDLFDDIEAPFPTMYNGAVNAGDFNNDGLVDVLLTGNDTTEVYLNNEQSPFALSSTNFPKLSNTHSSLGDYNNDGLLDLIMCGLSPDDSQPRTHLMRNIGDGLFTETTTLLPHVSDGFVEWIDLNNDGALDIIISGKTASASSLTKIFLGDRTGNFTETPTSLPPLENSAIAVDDFNKDNYQDILVLGRSDTLRTTQLFKNERGTLEHFDLPLTGIDHGDAVFSDFDADGLIDFVLTGNIEDEIVELNGNQIWVSMSQSVSAALYRQVQPDSFAYYNDVYAPSFERNDYAFSAIDAGDFDHDGLTDILITGIPSIAWLTTGIGNPDLSDWPHRSKPTILRNRGTSFENLELDIPATWSCCSNRRYPFESSGGFSHVSMAQFESSAILFADFNNDNSLDILREGDRQEYTSAIYENRTIGLNEPPAIPENLTSTALSCDSILLNWDPVMDDHTPSHKLQYDFYLGSTPGGNDIFSARNQQGLHNTYFQLPPLEDGTYYWSVNAMDGAKARSAYATETSFTVACVTTTQAPVSGSDFSVYPNPSKDHFFITAEEFEGPVHYRLTNQLGQAITEGTFYNIIEINDLAADSGILFLELQAGAHLFVKKVVLD